MAKRKITVTVDAETLEQAQALGVENLSAVVDAALHIHIERLSRRAALRELLDSWDRAGGPVSEEDQAAARAAFDELDALPTDRLPTDRPPTDRLPTDRRSA